MVTMDVRSAEWSKYIAKAMLATRITFMNELVNQVEQVGAYLERVRQGLGADPRIEWQILYVGCGYGDS